MGNERIEEKQNSGTDQWTPNKKKADKREWVRPKQ
jgi:hypothetical protein